MTLLVSQFFFQFIMLSCLHVFQYLDGTIDRDAISTWILSSEVFLQTMNISPVKLTRLIRLVRQWYFKKKKNVVFGEIPQSLKRIKLYNKKIEQFTVLRGFFVVLLNIHRSLNRLFLTSDWELIWAERVSLLTSGQDESYFILYQLSLGWPAFYSL